VGELWAIDGLDLKCTGLFRSKFINSVYLWEKKDDVIICMLTNYSVNNSGGLY